MKKSAFVNYLLIAAVLLLAILFVAKFSGPSILKLYIESGIGTCQDIPILCMAPEEAINISEVNEEYRAGLLPYEFPKIKISLPKGFTVIQERIKKVYYKRRKRPDKEAVVYLLYQEPNFFTNLFPQVRNQGINDNHEFIKRTMYAKIKDIKNLYDAFFIIIKGIFIPDIGNQKQAKMIQFAIAGKKGFINYNLGKTDNYFDCNVIDNNGAFFKIYIKDKGAALSLEDVFTIISTVSKVRE